MGSTEITVPVARPVRQLSQTPHKSWPVPAAGCYVPAVTFFRPSDDTIDFTAQSRYFSYLATTGLRGIVVLGTNAETFLLNQQERKELISCARQTLGPTIPIIAGVSGHSTSQVLAYIDDAYKAGADHVLLLPCAYFGAMTTPAVVQGFFAEIAQSTSLPIILYNFPAVCGGVDMDSDLITAIAKENPSVVGVKLTCGSVAKIARLAAVFTSQGFAVFGGQADFLLGGMAVGSSGCIAAFANVFPRAVARVFELERAGRRVEALELQQKLSLAEASTKSIPNTKYAASLISARNAGIGNAEELLRPRRPYVEPTTAIKSKIRQAILSISHLEDVTENLARASRL